MKHCYHVTKLKEELFRRKEVNSSYSLRSFSKFLEVHPSTVSAILNGKRKLPLENAKKIVNLLKLDSKNRNKFLLSVLSDKHLFKQTEVEVEEKLTLNDERYFKVIADWKYYAILNLLELESTKHEYNYIAERLNLRKEEISSIIKDLVALELLREDEKSSKWIRTTKSLQTPEDILSLALQLSHRGDLNIAKEKLESTPLSERDYSSITFTVNPSKISKIKEAIRAFRKQIAAIADDNNETEVYQMAVQLFPLSKKVKD